MMVASSSILLMIFSCAEEEDITQTEAEETQALKLSQNPSPTSQMQYKNEWKKNRKRQLHS